VAADPEVDAPLKAEPPSVRSPTPTEMANAAETMVGRMTRMLGRVELRHAEALAANDVLRRDCLSERLIQVRGLVATAAAAKARLERAAGSSQLAVSQEAYTGVGIAFLKTKLLAAEAQQCVIDPPRIGHTETSVTVEPLRKGGGGAAERDAAPPTPR
jgi:hypothetical protein